MNAQGTQMRDICQLIGEGVQARVGQGQGVAATENEFRDVRMLCDITD